MLRRLSAASDGKIAKRQIGMDKKLGRKGNQPCIHLQCYLQNPNRLMIILLQNNSWNTHALDGTVCKIQIIQPIGCRLQAFSQSALLRLQHSKIALYRFLHAHIQKAISQEGIGMRRVLQIVQDPLPCLQISAIDCIGAKKQRRTIGHAGILSLQRRIQRLIAIDFRIGEASLRTADLAPIQLRRTAAMPCRQGIIQLHDAFQCFCGSFQFTRLCIEQPPHGNTAEQKRFSHRKDNRWRCHQAFCPLIMLFHFFQIGEILKGGNQLPFSQKIGVIPITDDALRFLQKLLIFRKSGIGKKRIAKPKKG